MKYSPCHGLMGACLLALAVTHSAPVLAGDLAAGRKKANVCRVCHGLNGIGLNPTVPHIAGESELYLAKQLKAFRSGDRRHPQMSIIAKSLSDEDIANVATWYSSIEISVRMPE